MQKSERQKKLLNYINEQKTVTVSELVISCSVSKATIVRDLLELEMANLIHRTHGGDARRDN